jgi:hypothetical protein
MCERRQIDTGIRHSHLGAGRPVKRPGRNLQPTVRIGTAQAAAKNSVTRPLDRRVNADSKTKPRMPWVQQFSKLGSVGVLKLSCTTTRGPTRGSAGGAQPSTPWHGGPLRCAPPTAPLRGPPPSPPNRALPTVGLQSPLDKSWGQRHDRNNTPLETFHAVERFLDPAMREAVRAWIEQDIHGWRLKAILGHPPTWRLANLSVLKSN